MSDKVLIVDDVELNREVLKTILEDFTEIAEACDGQQAIDYIEENGENISAILLDIVMPNVDGFGVIDYMRNSGYIDNIPVLIISAENSTQTERQCLQLGVSDFIRKPFDRVVVRNRVRNIIDLFIYKRNLEHKIASQNEKLKKQNRLLTVQAEQLLENNDRIIDILGTVVEYRNLESGQHIKRVKGFTEILANDMMEHFPEYKLDAKSISVIVAASALHDIGKICISDAVLLKPGRLTEDEFAYMKSHTTKGCEIIEQIEGVWDEEYRQASYEICRHHHERFDGRGYPDRLVGDDIPISAQIVSIADVYDALVSKRVYKKAFKKDDAFEMILKGECGVFSPKLLESFRRCKAEFEALADEYAEVILEEL